MVGGKQGHTPYKIPSLQRSLFLCQLNAMEIIRLSSSWGESDKPQSWGYYRIKNSGVYLPVCKVVRHIDHPGGEQRLSGSEQKQ